jgi:hypothetical protein
MWMADVMADADADAEVVAETDGSCAIPTMKNISRMEEEDDTRHMWRRNR